ncbi:prolyl oligopeptidase family serine peptidase [Piscinibacter defluvii]|uniref:prolyl oligopeptidase family serine peptidase n=1 Tax=Piscinibacter defluvii TaxID=1796922 RepID=UPI000FDDA390|nr:prolyl oligopeptidase family serine peptidase [Piscinibacter defluvii]
MTRPVRLEDFAPLSSAATPAVQSAAFSPDGRWLAWLQPREGTPDLLDLHLMERESGARLVALEGAPLERPLPLDEELARERARQRYHGVTQFRWLRDGRTILSLQGRRMVCFDLHTRSTRSVQHADYIAAAELSPDGRTLVFASAAQLWALPMDGWPAVAARALTDDGSETLSHGVPDQITAEEVFGGSAYTWLPDGSRLLVASFHTAQVEPVVVTDGGQTRHERARYSFPGGPVATWSLALLDPANGLREELLAPDPAWPYFLGLVPRGEDEIVVQRLSRDQTSLQLLRLHWRERRLTTLLEQAQQPWINALGRPLFRAADGSFFLLHEREGVARIGLYDAHGAWQRDIGAEAGHVESLAGPDAAGDGLYFIATGADARERHLFHAAPAGGWAGVQVTREAGLHAVSLAPGAQAWLHVLDTPEQAPRVQLETLDGSVEHAFVPPAPREYERDVVVPRFVDLLAADGRTPLHAAIYEPTVPWPGDGRRPVLLLVYGGPHVQVVRRSRALTLDLRAQLFAQRGWLVFKVDNRGTSGRGIVFEKPLYGRLGQVEVEDQVAALQQLLALYPEADPARVGVCGWSYGGYMSLRCLQLRPDLFAAAAAGAPVVRWEDYDAPYTERYMGSPVATPAFPRANVEGYRAGRAAPRPDGRRQRLLLIHGMNDENVLLRHSAALMEQLAEQQLPYETLLLPGERHGVRAPAQRMYLEARILEFFERTLMK